MPAVPRTQDASVRRRALPSPLESSLAIRATAAKVSLSRDELCLLVVAAQRYDLTSEPCSHCTEQRKRRSGSS
jgi:hypothetical protein